LKEIQLDVFGAPDEGVGVTYEFGGMRVGCREAFNARAAGAADAFLGIFDHHAGGGDWLTVSNLRVDSVIFKKPRFFRNPNRRVLRRDGSAGNRNAAPANEFVNEPD
jgi:hypothetical protein